MKSITHILEKNVYLTSLGCSKNLVDAECMSFDLKKAGFNMVEDPAEAQVLIVNTCGFINPAKEESIQTILDLADYKTEGQAEVLVVTGCLSERYAEDMAEDLPEADILMGIGHYKDIVEALYDFYEEEKPESTKARIYLGHERPDVLAHMEIHRKPSTPYYAYLKIAEGCSNRCAFCAIPGIRGPFRSRPMEEIIEEAKALIDQGYDELILVAQDSGFYGLDLYKERRLADLLEKLSVIPNLKWIRVLYLYAEGLNDSLLDVMKAHTNILPYFDIPIQHGSDKILKRMNRKESIAQVEDHIESIKKTFPDAIIRTTMMVGFPGETEEDFEDLLNFVERMRFDRLGAFTYSPEEDTPAFSMEDQIADSVKEDRYRRLMELQSRISLEKLQDQVGKKLEVKIEGLSDDGFSYVARSWEQVPDVDPVIYVLNPTEEAVTLGQYYPVEIVEADEYEQVGVIQG